MNSIKAFMKVTQLHKHIKIYLDVEENESIIIRHHITKLYLHCSEEPTGSQEDDTAPKTELRL